MGGMKRPKWTTRTGLMGHRRRAQNDCNHYDFAPASGFRPVRYIMNLAVDTAECTLKIRFVDPTGRFPSSVAVRRTFMGAFRFDRVVGS